MKKETLEALRTFVDTLENREEVLRRKMREVETTPEEHGTADAYSYAKYELHYHILRYMRGELDDTWVGALTKEFRVRPSITRLRTYGSRKWRSRGDTAEFKTLVALADEIEYIYKGA